jgi:hypothetical protein
MARPTVFSQATADSICEQLAEGLSLRSICLDEAMPGKSTVFRWLESNEPFRDQYTRAREAQADSLADEIVDIADDGQRDYTIDPETGREIVNHDHIARAKLRVEARKWIACKLKPRKYGDRLLTELTGKDGGPIETRHVDELSDADLAAIATAGRPAPAEPEAGED